jgi:hypothetical protein
MQSCQEMGILVVDTVSDQVVGVFIFVLVITDDFWFLWLLCGS